MRVFACFILGTVLSQLPSTYAQTAPSGYAITFAKSDREWKYGIHHEPYDKVSEYLVEKLQAALSGKGLHVAPSPEAAQYRVMVELLEVTSHAATVKKPGNDVSATLQISAGNQIIYAKGYHGEAKTWNAPRGSVIRRAVDDLVRSMAEDAQMTKALSPSGKPELAPPPAKE